MLFKILVAFAGIYLFMILLLYLFQGQMLFLPQKDFYRTPAEAGLQSEDLWMSTEDGLQIHGWYFHNPAGTYAVILSHGNAGNISGRLDIAEMLYDMGLSVLLYDYRGYGKSEGRPHEKGLYRDIEAVVSFLRDKKNYRENRIVLYGRSLGGAVSAYAANRFDVAGLVLDSSFTDLKSMAGEIYPFVPSFLVRYELSTIDHLKALQNVPVMIFHSREDEIVNFRHGEKLYEAAGEPKKFVPLSGGHNDLFFTSYNTIRQSWTDFMDELGN